MILILGLPRSGSTLTYQCLVHALEGRYLSNVWNLLFATPLVGGLLSTFKCRRHRSTFQSSQGFVEGMCGPAEGRRFWSYWFGHDLHDHEVASEDPDAAHQRLQYIQRVLGMLCRPGRPFIGGYIGHALVVQSLVDLFPNAVFVRLTRDPVRNALSILKLLRDSPEESFSVTPKECLAFADAPPHRRAAAQVHFLNRRIERELDPDRTIRVAYEDLCRNPGREVARVAEFARTRGLDVTVRARLPPTFPLGVASRSDAKDLDILASELRSFESFQSHGGKQSAR